MAKPITAQMFTTIPARHHHNMVGQPFTFQHPQNHHAGTGFSVIILDLRSIGIQHSPSVVRRLGIAFRTFELFQKRGRIIGRTNRPTLHSIPRPTITYHVFQLQQGLSFGGFTNGGTPICIRRMRTKEPVTRIGGSCKIPLPV